MIQATRAKHNAGFVLIEPGQIQLGRAIHVAVARLNGAGCIGHTIKLFRPVTAEKIKVDPLKLGDAGHHARGMHTLPRCWPVLAIHLPQ